MTPLISMTTLIFKDTLNLNDPLISMTTLILNDTPNLNVYPDSQWHPKSEWPP